MLTEPVLWDSKVEVHETAPARRNQFLQDLYDEDEQYDDWFHSYLPNDTSPRAKNSIVNSVDLKTHKSESKTYYLDKDVTTWTDYKKVHYHPRSTVTLPDNMRNSELFDAWVAGVNLYKSSDSFSSIEEAIRFYAEECDSMQGFHVLCDLNNGFGGFASMLMEYLRDEFSGKCFAVFPILHHASGATLTKTKNASLSSLLTMSNLLETSSFLCPLSISSDIFHQKPRTFPHLVYNASLLYHSSAILASCLENCTRPYRLKNKASSLLHFCENLVFGSRKLSGMSAALPLPFDTEKYQYLIDLLLDHQITEPWCPVTPNFGDTASVEEKCFGQVVTLCGLESDQFFPLNKYKDLNFSKPDDVIEQYLTERYPSSSNSVSVLSRPISISAPYPHIFSDSVLENGFIRSPRKCSVFVSKLGSIEPHFSVKSPRKDSGENSKCNSVAVKVASVPVLTNLKSSTCLSALLKRCHDRASVLQRWVCQNRHCDSLLEEEVLGEAKERFKTLEQDYRYLSHDDTDSSD